MTPREDEVVVELAASHGAAGVGRVIAVGVRATALAAKRVLFGPIDPCGECEVCRRGGAPVCPTAKHRTAPLGPTVVAAARWVVALDAAMDALTDELAARVPGDIALAYTLYARANLAPREPTVIVGGGEVADFLAQIVAAKGIAPTRIAVADDATDAAARARVLAGFADQQIGNRPWRVLAASPEPAVVARAAGICGPRSVLVVLGGGTWPSLPASLAAREVTIITVAAAHPDLVVETAAMCVKGEISAPAR